MENKSVNKHRVTRSSIFKVLLDARAPITKQDIASKLTLSMPTVLQSLRELIDMGLIKEEGYQDSNGGRPAQQYGIVSDARYAIGVQVTGHHLSLILVDLAHQELATKTVRHKPTRNGHELGAMITSEIDNLIDTNHIDRSKFLGVGIAIPGIIDEKRDVVAYASTMDLHDLPLSEMRDAIPYRTVFRNDAELGGYADWYIRSKRVNLAYLMLGSGVGGSVLIDGHTYEGDHGRSGEFGHICVEPNGRLCSCGRHGCLQAYCSTRCLSDDLGITLAEFFKRLKAKNQGILDIWESYLTHLVAGITAIHMSLDCDVVIGGEMAGYLRPYLQEIQDRIKKADPFEEGESSVSISRISHHATQLGATLYLINDFAKEI